MIGFVYLCAFSSLRSRLVYHVAFGPSHQGYITYTKQLLAHVPDYSLTIFDCCYLSAELLINWQRQHPPLRALCSLVEGQQHSGQALLDVYFERWEIENNYGEIKHQVLGSVDGVRQELWGMLLAYNLVREESSRIAHEAGVSPLRISFMMALRDIQDEVMWCAIVATGTIPKS